MSFHDDDDDDGDLSIHSLAEPSGPSAWKAEKSKSSDIILSEAYVSAVTLFKDKLTKSERKMIWVDGKAGMIEIQRALGEAKAKYDDRKAGQSAVRTWLSMFSSRLVYYGGILDVLAQHHPEYVSLAWGSIKFVCMAVLNHEESISRLSEAFVLIGDALPRAKLKLELYGNDTMLQAVAQLYAQIMRFSQRAIRWYSESRIKHIYHAITQPYTLSYKDIVMEVDTCSKRIQQLAVDAAQAEQRVIHIKIERLEQLIIAQHGSIVSSGLLNTPFQLRNIEISQVLAYVDKTPLPSPEMSLTYHLAMRKRHLLEDSGYLDILDGCKQLNDWALRRSSSILLVKGTFRTRAKAKHVAASIIASTNQSQFPTVWILVPRYSKLSQQLSSLDILKQLVLQILQKNDSLLEDRSQPLMAKQFQCATTESEWFNLLGLVLIGMPEIYIVIDIEILRGNFGDGQAWPSMFMNLFRNLVLQSPKTIVKVAIIFYLTPLAIEGPGLEKGSIIKLDHKGRRGKPISNRSSIFQISNNGRRRPQ